ncbi:MAG: hypothetical protein QM817_01055 [Archangium sp.]
MRKFLLGTTLLLLACGRSTAPTYDDSLDPVRLVGPVGATGGRVDAGTDAGLVIVETDAGVIVTEPACAISPEELFGGFPASAMPASFQYDAFRRADMDARRLARAEKRGAGQCPEEAWAWISGDVIVVATVREGHRASVANLPSQGAVRHLELISDPNAGGWVVAWASANQGLFTAVLNDQLDPALPQRLPDSVMPAAQPRPFELVFAWGRPFVLTQRLTEQRHPVLTLSSVPLNPGPAIENRIESNFALSFDFQAPGAPAALFDGTSLFVTTVFQVLEFSAPDQQQPLVQGRGGEPWHDTSIVSLPPSPQFPGGPVIVGAGTGQGARRIEYTSSCFTSGGGRCAWWESINGGTWGGGSELFNHAGVSAAKCGRKLAVALRSFNDIGDCLNYGYCLTGDLHVELLEPGMQPLDFNLTPRADVPGYPRGTDDREVFSPVIFERFEPDHAWPVADVAWIQASVDGGVELRLQRAVLDCTP